MDHIRYVFIILGTCAQFYFQSNLSNRDMMNRVQVGQKRAGTPLSNQIVKQRQAMPAQRNTRPAQAKDVKERFIFLCDFIVKWSFRPKTRFLTDCGVIRNCTMVWVVNWKINLSKSFRSLPIKRFKLKSSHQNWQRRIMILNITKLNSKVEKLQINIM